MRLGGVGSRLTICPRTAAKDPRKGNSPVKSSYRITPRLYWLRQTTSLFAADLPRQAEIHDDRLAALFDHDVGRLQVAVDDAVVMRFLQRLGELADHVQYLPLGKRFVGLNEIGKRTPFDIGHRNVVLRFDLADVVDRADVGMSQRRSRPRLPIEPLAKLARRILVEAGRFERHAPAKLRVFREMNRPHRALADNLDDPIPAELPRQTGAGGHNRTLGARGGRKRFTFVLDADCRGAVRSALCVTGCLPNLIGRPEVRAQQVGDFRMLRKKHVVVERFAPIDSVEIVSQRRRNSRVCRLNLCRLIVHSTAFDDQFPSSKLWAKRRPDRPLAFLSYRLPSSLQTLEAARAGLANGPSP
jgi:hypothetical protein